MSAELVAKAPWIERGTAASRWFVVWAPLVVAALSLVPLFNSGGAIDRMTALFIYIIMATMWNALAGFGGLVSVGHQLFFGMGAYLSVRLAAAGLNPFLAIPLASCVIGIVAYPLSHLALRLRGGEFAIGIWVASELTHLLVNLDPLIQGETGTSMISLSAYGSDFRRTIVYLSALGAMTVVLAGLFLFLRSPAGAAIQAIRDNEDAAMSIGVDTGRTKRMIFMISAIGVGIAGALWLTSAISFQPKTYFSVQWTAYMIFMVLVGGIGTFEGAILGAILFFLIETWFGQYGVWYLTGLGVTALLFSLFAPKGLWGLLQIRFGISLVPLNYMVKSSSSKDTVKPFVS